MYNALRYIGLTLRHKWFVFVAGRRLRVPIWQLITHDWSKFLLVRAYGNAFFGDKARHSKGLQRAWLYHQNHEPHHWEYWIPRTTHTRGLAAEAGGPFPMPEKYVREMVADWLAATRTYTGEWPGSLEEWTWFQENRGNMLMNPWTWVVVRKVLGEWRWKDDAEVERAG